MSDRMPTICLTCFEAIPTERYHAHARSCARHAAAGAGVEATRRAQELAAEVRRLRAELDRARPVIDAAERAREAFSFMPALNEAFHDPSAAEIRKEVNDALDWFYPQLVEALGKYEAAVRAYQAHTAEDTP